MKNLSSARWHSLCSGTAGRSSWMCRVVVKGAVSFDGDFGIFWGDLKPLSIPTHTNSEKISEKWWLEDKPFLLTWPLLRRHSLVFGFIDWEYVIPKGFCWLGFVVFFRREDALPKVLPIGNSKHGRTFPSGGFTKWIKGRCHPERYS